MYKIHLVPKLRYPSSRENKSKPTVYLFGLLNMLVCSTLLFLVGLYKYDPYLRVGSETHLCNAQAHSWPHLALKAGNTPLPALCHPVLPMDNHRDS